MRLLIAVYYKRILLACFLLLIVCHLFFSGCSGSGDNSSKRANGQLIPAVEAVQSRYGSLPLTERLSGVVRARNQVELYPQISAPIVAVYVQNGDLVTAEEPLLKLRDTEFREQLKQAEANFQVTLAQAKQAEAELKQMNGELERSIELSEKSLISNTELETIETQAIASEANVELTQARVKQAQAMVDQRREELSRTVIRAPVAGTIGNRNAEIGMMVNPAMRLFTLGQLDSVRVEVILTDRMLTYIEDGQRIEIRAANVPAGVLEASLSRISPFLHPVTHSTEAEIDLANPGYHLKSGMFVTVDIYYGESEQATLVPLSALYENPLTGGTGVYVCRDSLYRIPVEPPETGGLTEPLSFEFIPVEVVARGRMSAGIYGIGPDSWVVTIGQDLFGGESGQARVRPVDWTWVEHLQNLQREDLLQEIIQEQQTAGKDTVKPNL